MDEPTCPWCGAKMFPERVRLEKFFRHYAVVCARCSAQGPLVTGMGSEEALKAKAVSRAIRREKLNNET